MTPKEFLKKYLELAFWFIMIYYAIGRVDELLDKINFGGSSGSVITSTGVIKT